MPTCRQQNKYLKKSIKYNYNNEEKKKKIWNPIDVWHRPPASRLGLPSPLRKCLPDSSLTNHHWILIRRRRSVLWFKFSLRSQTWLPVKWCTKKKSQWPMRKIEEAFFFFFLVVLPQRSLMTRLCPSFRLMVSRKEFRDSLPPSTTLGDSMSPWWHTHTHFSMSLVTTSKLTRV